MMSPLLVIFAKDDGFVMAVQSAACDAVGAFMPRKCFAEMLPGLREFAGMGDSRLLAK